MYKVTKQLIFKVCLLGFMNGLTLLISGNTLNFWLAKEGINKSTIGLFSIVALPYAINFVWAPILDIKKIPFISSFLGHRLGWVVVIQVLLAISIFLMSFLSPLTKLQEISVIAFIISFLSSTQDTALSAIRTSMIPNNKQGLFSGVYILGYRIGMVVAGSGAIYCSAFISWKSIYQIFSLIVLLFPLLLILFLQIIKEDKDKPIVQKESLQNFSLPFISFFLQIVKPIGSWRLISIILIFLIIYRLPDNFIYVMTNSFLLELGFNAVEIAYVGKFFGAIAATFGGLLASYIMQKVSMLSSLIYFGCLHAIAHSCFIIQDIVGKNINILIVINIFESFTGGMAMSAYIGFISSLCKGRYRATQYSVLSAMMGVSRSLFPTLSGYIVDIVGWRWFFTSMTVSIIPVIMLAKLLVKHLNRVEVIR